MDRTGGSREAGHVFGLWGRLLDLLTASPARIELWQWILQVTRPSAASRTRGRNVPGAREKKKGLTLWPRTVEVGP